MKMGCLGIRSSSQRREPNGQCQPAVCVCVYARMCVYARTCVSLRECVSAYVQVYVTHVGDTVDNWTCVSAERK